MIQEFSSQEVEEILNTKGSEILPKYSNEQRWKNIIENPMLSPSFQNYKEYLDKLMSEPITHVPASLYLNFRRTGSRSPHDGIISSRRSHLMAFVIGECLERKGRYLDAIMDYIWAICEESSWVIPAHSQTTLPAYTDISWIDLVSAETGRTLAEVLYIIGDRLDDHDPMIRQRAIYEIDRRCWTPYMQYDNMWWMFRAGNRSKLNNWTAVCNCGVVGSAILAMNDNQKLAQMIEKCLKSMNDFLLCFDKQGGCDEGPGYWGYGVSNYVWLSYLLEMRTGKISLLNAPEVKDIAMFPQRTTLSGNSVVNFSDCSPKVSFSPSLLFYLGQRLSLPEVSAFAQYQYDLNPRISFYDIRSLTWIPVWGPVGRWTEKWKPEKHFYYSEMQWLISRANPNDEKSLMLAVKGGHNAENHNQNDVGNFIVYYGGESLIVDLGAGTYTRDYFSSKRYEILVNSSWGHNVPLVNGYQQPPGGQYSAQVLGYNLSDTEDVLELELSNAYPDDAKIRILKRRASLHRDGKLGWVEIDDQIRLDSDKGNVKLPLYVAGEVIKEDSATLRIVGQKAEIRIQYQPQSAKPIIEKVESDDKRIAENIRRIVFDIPITEGSGRLLLKIMP
ncbi:MAG: heparinase II/III domain-containing protein [Candidatus Poribacteria bacterium]